MDWSSAKLDRNISVVATGSKGTLRCQGFPAAVFSGCRGLFNCFISAIGLKAIGLLALQYGSVVQEAPSPPLQSRREKDSYDLTVARADLSMRC